MSDAKTLGELKKQGYQYKTVRGELRSNMRKALAEKKTLFPDIVGYEDTVVPQMVHAILAQHDILLLGLRGQAKTRLIRSLTNFLDPMVPIIEGAQIHEDPMNPVTPTGRKMVREAGDDLPITWLSREDRYNEKLATPDVTIADLIGDIDPIKAMSKKLDFANEEVIHYGIVPRSNRSIFAINELPDLQPRIQVGLLNILEEQDFQIRGFPVRMNLDVLMVFTANPEDYTNRGNIITPLKDRIEAQILTHYPKSREEGVEIIKQESWQARDSEIKMEIPDYFYSLVEQTAIEARTSDFTDGNSGVSARMPITLLETVISAMERRAVMNGEDVAYARICDLYAALPAITGKIELIYKGEKEGIAQVAEHLVGKAIKEHFNEMVDPNYKRGRDPKHTFENFAPAVQWFEGGNKIELDDTMGHNELVNMIKQIPALENLVKQLQPGLNSGNQYGFMEFMLEGLAQNFVLSKFKLVTGTRYMDELSTMSTSEEF